MITRTTVDIDAPIFRDLEKLQKEEGKSPGRPVSELLAEATGWRRRGPARKPPFFRSNTTGGRLLVDPADKDAFCEVLECR